MKPLNKALSTAVAASVAAVVVAAVPASAAANGRGQTKTTTSVLSLAIGKDGGLLNLNLLRDTGSANIDTHGADPTGSKTSLVALSLKAAGVNVSTPAIGTSAPGGPADVAGPTVDTKTLGVPAALATATITPAALHSDFSPSGAHSTIGAAMVQNLTVAGGGLAKVALLQSNLDANALTAQAGGTRGVTVSNIELLNLGALLQGIGISPTSLSVNTLSDLLGQLNVVVNGLAAGTPLASQVSTLTSSITGLQAAIATATSTSSPLTVPPTLSQQLTSIVPVPVPGLAKAAAAPLPIAIPTNVADATALVTTLQGQLKTLLGASLAALDSTPLVKIAGTTVGVTTKAADTVANSSAGVSALPLKVTVAGKDLPVLDATAVADTVNGALNTANGALNGVLSKIGLPTNLVSVSVLDKASNVGQNGTYTVATAGLTALTLRIAAVDPAKVLSGVTALNATPVGTLLSTVGIASATTAALPALPALPNSAAMAAVNTALGQVAPLLGGTTLQVASLSSASTFTAAPDATPSGTPGGPVRTNLPRTGGHPELGILGVIFAALALGGVRWSRSKRESQLQG
ncbi:MAG: hypothetical protein NVS3B21_29070 [Acidimicrobiales bacterium]